MNTSTLLILDIGSSSVRAHQYDRHPYWISGAGASRTHRFETEPAGANTADAHQLRALVEECMDIAVRRLGIRAVGTAVFVGNLMGIDEHGQPTTPVYTYADARSAEDAAALRAELNAEDVHQRTGCPIHMAYHPARIRWLQRTQPDLVARTVAWTDFVTWLYSQWFGRPVPCSTSVASWSGLLNRATLGWDEAVLGQLGIEAGQLPTLADATYRISGLSPDYAARWPALADVPFFLAVGDGAAANVGAGAVEPSTAALTIGTTAALRVLTPEPPARVPAGLWQYRLNATHALMGGATSEGSNVNVWGSATLQLPRFGELETQLAARTPDEHGLTVLPMLAGERSPGFSIHGVGTLHGLRLSTTPLDIAQALAEAVAIRLSIIADQMQEAGISFGNILAGGGALSHSPFYVQTVADALNAPLTLKAGETTGRGVAMLLMDMLDGRSFTDYPRTTEKMVTPRPDGVQALAAARQRQEALYARLYGDG